MVCGWRKDRQDAALTRNFPSRVANALISRLSKVYLHDYGCTLRIYKREYIQGIPLYGEMHRFIPIYVTWAGAKLVEMPVRHHARTIGKSKYGLGRIPKVLLDLTTVKFLRDFYVTHPSTSLGGRAFGFFAFGLLTLMAAGGVALAGTLDLSLILAASAVLMVMLGTVEITLGIIAEVLIRMHHDVRDRPPYRIQRVHNLETRRRGRGPRGALMCGIAGLGQPDGRLRDPERIHPMLSVLHPSWTRRPGDTGKLRAPSWGLLDWPSWTPSMVLSRYAWGRSSG